jgi:hypothetical protein
MLGGILHLDRVAQVRLVGAVKADRISIGNAAEGLRNRLALGKRLKHIAQDRLHRFPDLFLRDEAHLKIKLVELAGQAVSARVLIAEAGRDLEIAVEAGHHQKLLVLLRCLRQRVELAVMDAAGHQEVARAFGRGGGQDGRLELVEARIFHPAAHVADHLGARHDVGVQRLAAQIEEPVAQARVFGEFRLAKHLKRQFSAAPSTSISVANTSISPVGSASFTVSGVRSFTLPSMRRHHSERTVSASEKAGESGSMTICVMP